MAEIVEDGSGAKPAFNSLGDSLSGARRSASTSASKRFG
jgi:hypothetical protein